MLDRLTEALIGACNTAVEEQTFHFGPHYASALEGYGDMARELLALQENVKALKKSVSDVVDYVGSQDTQELYKALVLTEGKANLLAYEAVKMCACIKRFQTTLRDHSGGDLLDLLNGEEDEDE